MNNHFRVTALLLQLAIIVGCSGSNSSSAGNATATGGQSTTSSDSPTGGTSSMQTGNEPTGGDSSDTGGKATGGTTTRATGGAGGKTSVGGSAAATGGAGTPVQASVAISAESPKAVATTYFGENYWSWIPAWGDPVKGIQSAVADLKLNLIRAGGANNDQQNPVAFSLAEMDDFIAYAHAIGAEPLVQIPLLKNLSGAPATADDAAAIVTYLNQTKSYGVKYFSIGNEPDLYTDQDFKDASYSATDYCSSFSEFAAAMKAVDPSIQIMGPELSWKYVSGNDWLTPFLKNCGSSVDIVSVHRYPFTADECTENNAYSDATAFRTAIASLRSIMKAAGQDSKPLAITEANITWDGDPSNKQLAASPQTFPAGLWFADSIGVGLESGLFSINYWSLSEGYSLGLFSGSKTTPPYYVLQMFSTKFGNQVLSVTGAPTGISVYAGRDATAAKTSVFVVNKKNAVANLDITFQGLTRTDPVKISTEAHSITAIELLDDGSTPVVTSYTADMKKPTVVTN